MADEKAEQKPQENAPDKSAADKPAEKDKKSSILPWIIIAVTVVISVGAGFGLGRLLAAGHKSQPSANADPNKPETAAEKPKAEKSKAEKSEAAKGDAWYFDIDPVVANLNEQGATRYVRAALTLEMSSELSVEKGTPLLQQKKPLLTNILTIYLAGLSVDATRGDKNLKRIQSEICDAFNERLFPNDKPLVKRILIKEFAVQ